MLWVAWALVGSNLATARLFFTGLPALILLLSWLFCPPFLPPSPLPCLTLEPHGASYSQTQPVRAAVVCAGCHSSVLCIVMSRDLGDVERSLYARYRLFPCSASDSVSLLIYIETWQACLRLLGPNKAPTLHYVLVTFLLL